MQQNHSIYSKQEQYTGTTVTTKAVHYSPQMHREADTARIKPRVKQSTFDLKHACQMAKTTDCIQMVSRSQQQREQRRARR